MKSLPTELEPSNPLILLRWNCNESHFRAKCIRSRSKFQHSGGSAVSHCSLKLVPSHVTSLTLSRRKPLSYRNQSIVLLCKLMDWFP